MSSPINNLYEVAYYDFLDFQSDKGFLPRLNPYDFIVYSLVHGMTFGKKKMKCSGVSFVAKNCRIDYKTALKVVNRLRDRGLLKVEEGSGKRKCIIANVEFSHDKKPFVHDTIYLREKENEIFAKTCPGKAPF